VKVPYHGSPRQAADSESAPVKAVPASAEVRELRLELMRQWLDNHAEHCGVHVPPWPQDCHWPMPEVLRDRVPTSAAYLLLLEASGVSAQLRLVRFGDSFHHLSILSSKCSKLLRIATSRSGELSEIPMLSRRGLRSAALRPPAPHSVFEMLAPAFSMFWSA
jgi:hypothetical protein